MKRVGLSWRGSAFAGVRSSVSSAALWSRVPSATASVVGQRRWTSNDLSKPEQEEALEEVEEKMTPLAYRQDATRRKDPIIPFLDVRSREALYNPVVDDWVDLNNPRWKALKHTFYRPGPFFIGKCVSVKTAKTAMIEVPYWIRSRKYGKHMALRQTTRFMSHDEDQICEVGDTVEIRQSKKWSKKKNTVVTRILKKEPGNAYLQEHPEFSIVRSRAELRKRIEQIREEELVAAGARKQQEEEEQS